jgi:hypothetical protein
MHASPGVYAVLVGSGMSTAAGIPTGWQVLVSLVRRVATLDGVALEEAGEDPVDWFTAIYGHTPRYEELIERIAPTDHTRRALLREHFEHSPGAAGPIEPTQAHCVLAQLCAEGRVRVVLTTNFDHLLERALEDAGASAQILSTPADRDGMEPLQHAKTTVIKLHGDYTGTMLNTAEELAGYPDDLEAIVDEVLDRYGVVVVGWSADWDRALEARIAACQSRRYPMYWLRYQGQLTEKAAALVSGRRATLIDIDGADEFFVDFAQRIARLDQVALRRNRPALLWTHRFRPQEVHPSDGWAALPLLWLRAIAVASPAALDDCGPITPVERRELVNALANAAITPTLAALNASPGLSALAEPDHPGGPTHGSPIQGWWAPPNALQSDMYASYVAGGDATAGVSARFRVQLPSQGQGASVTFILDVAVSLELAIQAGDAARVWAAGLVLTAVLAPQAFSTVLPAQADVSYAEIHAFTPPTDGHNNARPGQLDKRLSLTSLGVSLDPQTTAVGVAMHLPEPLTDTAAAELVAAAVERIALKHGSLDTTAGMGAVRAYLGI